MWPSSEVLEGPFGIILGSPYNRLGPSWAISHLSQGHLTTMSGYLRQYSSNIKRFGAVLGPAWASLGRSWGHSGPSWEVLGALGAILGPSWGHLGAILGHLGGHLGHFGADLGPTWAILRSSSVPSWGSWRSSWIILDLARKFGRCKCVPLDEVAQKWHCDVPQRRWQTMATDWLSSGMRLAGLSSCQELEGI